MFLTSWLERKKRLQNGCNNSWTYFCFYFFAIFGMLNLEEKSYPFWALLKIIPFIFEGIIPFTFVGNPITFAKNLKILKEKIKNGQLEETTYEGYYGLINLRILPYFKDFILQDINEETVENWLGYLSRTKTKSNNFVHPTTIAHAFKVLSNMFNFAKLERILKENPCSFVKKKPTEKPDEKEYFTLEEMDYVKELLSTTNIRLKTAMFIIMDTGCRREELLGLTWRDIDFEKKTININKAVATISTKSGVPNYRIVEKNVKSRNSNRVIGIPNACISLL